MHEHKNCNHKNLKHCSKCDVVYCEDCKKEWGSSGWTWTIPNDTGTTWTYLDGGTTIPCGTHYL